MHGLFIVAAMTRAATGADQLSTILIRFPEINASPLIPGRVFFVHVEIFNVRRGTHPIISWSAQW